MTSFGPLVSTEWLADRLGEADVKVIDGSWRMPGSPPARNDYLERHIAGAVFFDIDAIADQETSLPHMLPSAEAFADAVGALGISDRDRIVVYDDQGLFSAPRVWRTFRIMGQNQVAVLDGGLKKWLAEGRPLVSGETAPAPALYRATRQPDLVASATDVKRVLVALDAVVVDTRSAARFRGEEPEPRPGLRSGHMPGALNTPSSLFSNSDGTVKSPEEIAAIFRDAGLDLNKRIVTSCGSGVSAATASLALEILGCENHALYDGSWAEWGDEANHDEEFPVIAAM